MLSEKNSSGKKEKTKVIRLGVLSDCSQKSRTVPFHTPRMSTAVLAANNVHLSGDDIF